MWNEQHSNLKAHIYYVFLSNKKKVFTKICNEENTLVILFILSLILESYKSLKISSCVILTTVNLEAKNWDIFRW